MAGDTRHDPGTGMPGITRVGWNPDGKSGPWASVLEGASALINLAGESLAAKRWNPARKAQQRDSRIRATRSLAAALKSASTPPPVFISGSAVGYYGPTGDAPLNETSPPGSDFLAQLCQDWEREALVAARNDVRIVLLRTGIVLERSGGALPQMMLHARAACCSGRDALDGNGLLGERLLGQAGEPVNRVLEHAGD